MIYTVTLNPSIDYTMEVEALRTGMVNRAGKTHVSAGGKGINVSKVLSSLGVKNCMLGFTAGFTGEEIERSVNEAGLTSDFIRLEGGLSRINVKLCSTETTDINAPGPVVTKKALSELFDKLDRASRGDIVVLAGAIPKSLPAYTYQQIMERLSGRGIRFIVDAEGETLLSTLSFKPFLIKPNRAELEALFSTRVVLYTEVDKYGMELRKLGAENVLISLDNDGAVLFADDGEKYYCPAPAGTVINPVGAGDAMVAGFIYSLLTSGTHEDALKTGVAAGSATAFQSGLAGKEDIMSVKRRLG